MIEDTPIIGITMGDPAGIGPEVIVKAYREIRELSRPIVIGDADVISAAIDLCGLSLSVQPVETVVDARFDSNEIPVLDLDNISQIVQGDVREDYGAASLAYIERAIELAQTDAIDAMTTAPINKQATKLAGTHSSGQSDSQSTTHSRGGHGGAGSGLCLC